MNSQASGTSWLVPGPLEESSGSPQQAWEELLGTEQPWCSLLRSHKVAHEGTRRKLRGFVPCIAGCCPGDAEVLWGKGPPSPSALQALAGKMQPREEFMQPQATQHIRGQTGRARVTLLGTLPHLEESILVNSIQSFCFFLSFFLPGLGVHRPSNFHALAPPPVREAF